LCKIFWRVDQRPRTFIARGDNCFVHYAVLKSRHLMRPARDSQREEPAAIRVGATLSKRVRSTRAIRQSCPQRSNRMIPWTGAAGGSLVRRWFTGLAVHGPQVQLNAPIALADLLGIEIVQSQILFQNE
jgi:hypothetical protein